MPESNSNSFPNFIERLDETYSIFYSSRRWIFCRKPGVNGRYVRFQKKITWWMLTFKISFRVSLKTGPWGLLMKISVNWWWLLVPAPATDPPNRPHWVVQDRDQYAETPVLENLRMVKVKLKEPKKGNFHYSKSIIVIVIIISLIQLSIVFILNYQAIFTLFKRLN